MTNSIKIENKSLEKSLFLILKSIQLIFLVVAKTLVNKKNIEYINLT